ncbi:NACHT domain-containing protein [Nocardia takedensis]
MADEHMMAQRIQVPVEDDPMLHNGQFHRIADAYRRIGTGRLVVMGKIGSGKSSLVRYLALEMLGPENGETVPERVPVVLNIASWNPRKVKFEQWMATIINRDHPRIRIEDVLLLFRAGRILPILDGLDEFQLPSHRVTALGVLNADSSIPVILAGRRDEYAAAVAMKSPLLRAWAIDLEPLTTEDLRDYLPAAADVPGKAALWNQVIDELENNPDTELVGSVLDSPLMVALAHMVYGSAAAHQDPRELVRTTWTSRQELESRLFDSLLDVAFPEHVDDTALGNDDEERPRRDYDHESATRWLR